MSVPSVQVDFFRLLFSEQPGYICICSESQTKGDFEQHFFYWPDQEYALNEYVSRWRRGKNVWFCVNLLSQKIRRKEYCLPTNLVWSDLDEASPKDIDPPPSIVIESSPGRSQALWRLESYVEAYVAEDYSKRIAYSYSENGADPTGWDLTQLLRVPGTRNLKYADAPQVNLISAVEEKLSADFFEILPEVTLAGEIDLSDVPNPEELPPADQIVAKYLIKLKRTNFFDRWNARPSRDDPDWSGKQWNLIKVCLEAGMTNEEAFVIAVNSPYNKYERDKRPLRYQWKEVLKAKMQLVSFEAMMSTGLLEMPELIPGQQYGELTKSFIDEYREWGEKASDAPGHYHDLSGFILLSSLLAGSIKLDTMYGTVRPNLWGLVLGDSTLTRKSTAMRMATDIMNFVDDEILIASEGSMEGILDELAARPSKTSVFWRDEVTGFLEGVRKKDYQSGMIEMFTHLYDAPPVFTRRVKKGPIRVREPIFIFFGGGIKEKMYQVMDDSYVYSGFLPRFLVVSGDTDLSALRRTGPPTGELVEFKQEMYARLNDMYRAYAISSEVQILNQQGTPQIEVEAILTEEAWELFGDVEYKLNEAAAKSNKSDVALPTFDRLSKSILKMSVLLAATRQKPEEGLLQVTTEDLLHSCRHVQDWGNYSIDLISNVGRTVLVRTLERVLGVIERHPGITRGTIMRMTNLSKREMSEVEETLEDRGQIQVDKKHGGRQYTAI